MRSLVLIAGVMATTIGCSWPGFKHSRTVVQTIDATDVRSIDLTTFNGEIAVKVHDEPSIDMEIRYTARGETEGLAKQNCDALDCDVSQQDDRLVIQATKPAGQWSPSAAFTLTVPADCRLDLQTSNGRVTADDVHAGLNINTSNGTVRCSRLAGMVSVRTSNGEIKIQDSECGIDLKTSNGSMTYQGMLIGDQNEMVTSNGSVQVELPGNALCEVNASTSNGKVRCELPVQKTIDKAKRSLHVVTGQPNGDQAQHKLSIRTSNGSVKLKPWSSTPSPQIPTLDDSLDEEPFLIPLDDEPPVT